MPFIHGIDLDLSLLILFRSPSSEIWFPPLQLEHTPLQHQLSHPLSTLSKYTLMDMSTSLLNTQKRTAPSPSNFPAPTAPHSLQQISPGLTQPFLQWQPGDKQSFHIHGSSKPQLMFQGLVPPRQLMEPIPLHQPEHSPQTKHPQMAFQPPPLKAVFQPQVHQPQAQQPQQVARQPLR